MNTEAKGLTGLRVLSLESRRSAEMAKLIENYGGEPIVSPAMREVPLESNTEAQEFARRLAAGEFDIAIFLTGNGTRALARVVETVYPIEKFADYLKRCTVVARGPKSVAALKELGVSAAVAIPEPNTWHEILATLDRERIQLSGKRIAIQEYGEPNPDLLEGLLERGATVMEVPVYRWALPENREALITAVERLIHGQIDLALFTTSVQIVHLLKVAKELNAEDRVRAALTTVVIGSIGPVTSEELREQGIHVDFEPEHPKMGFLVNEAARRMPARPRPSTE